jgi:redox-sensitive bicupin YhaK (pirin superfamily)
VQPADIPVVAIPEGGAGGGPGGVVRVIAGPLADVRGPAEFAVTVQILDVELEAGVSWTYEVPEGMDNAMFYAFKGDAALNGGTPIRAQQICRFDTSGPRAAQLKAGAGGFRCMVFTGKQTKEDLVWQGPFVCASKPSLMKCFQQYQSGRFPPVRVKWDYKDASKHPK